MKNKKSEFLKQSITLVKAAGLRWTESRRLILEAILDHRGPVSAPVLIETLSGLKACDPVTIWRTLPVFEKLGLIEKCDFSKTVAFFETKSLNAPTNHHHHHVICRSCERIDPLEYCIADQIEKFLSKKGYTQMRHQLEFTALCPACR